jgi:hypothetical protein
MKEVNNIKPIICLHVHDGRDSLTQRIDLSLADAMRPLQSAHSTATRPTTKTTNDGYKQSSHAPNYHLRHNQI